MQLVRLGRTELRVPVCGFGGIPLGRDHLSDGEAADIVRRTIDAGLTLIDTFSGYGGSERRIAMALRGRRDKVTIVTKARSRFAPREFEAMAEESLRTLGVECLDVFTDGTYRGVLARRFAEIGLDPEACRDCRQCVEECPYDLPVPERLREAFQLFA